MAHSHHHHKEDRRDRVKRYAVSTSIGYLFTLFQALILYFLLRSFGGESDTGHTFVDSTNYLVGTILAILVLRSVMAEVHAERLGLWINSAFFIVGALLIFYQIYTGEKHQSLPWYHLFFLGAVGGVGNYMQTVSFGHHEADGHTQDTSNEGHIFFDLLNSFFVMLVALFIALIGLPLFPLIKSFIAVLIIVTAGILLPQHRYMGSEGWKPWQWISYELGLLLFCAAMAYLVFKGSVGYIDKLTAGVVASGMLLTGLQIAFGKKHVHQH